MPRAVVFHPCSAGAVHDDNATSTDPDVRADGGLDHLGFEGRGRGALEATLTDDHGLRCRNVQTRLSTLEGGGIVAFCGEVNSRTPLGGYGGYQCFIASRSVANESTMPADDFAQAWSLLHGRSRGTKSLVLSASADADLLDRPP